MDFTKLYTDHYDQVFRTAKAFLKSEEDAADAVQDTFLKAYESLDSYDSSVSSVSTWLVMQCKSICQDKLRKRRRESKHIVPLHSGNEHLLDSAEDHTTPLETVDAEQVELRIYGIFAQLPDNLREAATLRLIDNLSFKEVAERMGVPVNTAKTWVQRAKKKLMQPISPQ